MKHLALSDVMSVEGLISKEDAGLLYDLASQAKHGIVEVGSFRGRSTIALARGSLSGNQVRVFAVDPHVEFTGVNGGRYSPGDRKAFLNNIHQTGVASIVQLVSAPSPEAVQEVKGCYVDLLFIDGDHSPEAVEDDMCAWQVLFPPNYEEIRIAFHDSHYPGPKAAIQALIGQGWLKEHQVKSTTVMLSKPTQ